MEKLIVRDFLVIKSADFEIGRINLIIGPQANGKSLIAKLLYFFRRFLSSTYLESVEILKKDIGQQAVTRFEEYFPRYTWADQLFSTRYETDDIWIDISSRETGPGQVALKFDYSSNLISLREKLRSTYRQRQGEVKGDGRGPRRGPDVGSVITLLLNYKSLDIIT